MPWRSEPGEAPDPYKVWLSEIMLQQTTVAAVIPYFERFIARFPTIDILAAAPLEEVMEAWAGLGYYARARNMHACAKRVAALGGFPRDVSRLRELPGIGQYTACAIASIAFGVPVVPIDGNVERVVARLFAIQSPLPGSKPIIAAACALLGNQEFARARPADFTQALFDLGAKICRPGAPTCALCPWQGVCQAHAQGDTVRLPVKAAKKARPVRYGAHFWLEDTEGVVLLRRRPARGLLGGMLELPGTAWRGDVWSATEAIEAAPQAAAWRHVGVAHHGFTHFELVLDVYAATVPNIVVEGLRLPVTSLQGAAFPSVMTRCVTLVFRERGR
jgi:A/G-specific adenine glycosylase